MSRIRAANPCTGPRTVPRVMTVELLCGRSAGSGQKEVQRTQRNVIQKSGPCALSISGVAHDSFC